LEVDVSESTEMHTTAGTPAHGVMQPFTPAFLDKQQPGRPGLGIMPGVVVPVERQCAESPDTGAEVLTENGWDLIRPGYAGAVVEISYDDATESSESNTCSGTSSAFFLSEPVAFRRVYGLESYSRTSGESNHHRQCVSDTKSAAIPTKPRGQLPGRPVPLVAQASTLRRCRMSAIGRQTVGVLTKNSKTRIINECRACDGVKIDGPNVFKLSMQGKLTLCGKVIMDVEVPSLLQRSQSALGATAAHV